MYREVIEELLRDIAHTDERPNRYYICWKPSANVMINDRVWARDFESKLDSIYDKAVGPLADIEFIVAYTTHCMHLIKRNPYYSEMRDDNCKEACAIYCNVPFIDCEDLKVLRPCYMHEVFPTVQSNTELIRKKK